MAGLFGGGKKEQPAPAPAQAATASPAPPGTQPEDFRRQQTAYWQNLLAGMGQGEAGGGLPTGIQANIDRQASLIPQ